MMIEGIRREIKHNHQRSYCWHEELVIIKVLSGKVKIRIWAKDHLLRKGDFIVLNIGTIYNIEKVSAHNKVTKIYIAPQYGHTLHEDFMDVVYFCNSTRYRRKHPDKYHKINEHIENMMIAIESYYKQGVESFVHIAVKKTLTYLIEQFDYVTCGVNLKKFTPKVAERNRGIYAHLIRENNMKLSLQDIAKDAGVNYSYFRADIAKRYGCGYNWLRYTLMTEKATRLLLSTDKKVSEIAEMCGFSDYKYFVKYFKIFYDCTPSIFRNQYQSLYIAESQQLIPV